MSGRTQALGALGVLGVLGMLAMLAGCGSYTTYRTTRIAKPGQTEWLFGAQASGAIAQDDSTKQAAPLPEFAVAARRAVHDRVELQANATLFPIKAAPTGSLELAGKLRIGARGRWSLAVGTGVGYRLAESGGATIEGVFASVPVIAGIELGRHQLVVSVAAGYQRWYASGAHPVGIPFVGDSVGFLWQVGRHWALLPEAGVAWSPTPNFMTEDSRLFHVGIAALWTR
ncbi:MAG: hypothetical protein H6Q90_2459 [Deltaproteobacteria bacterium]|nr:hypothetical protein [Deltaproteobacteria bacterium]